MALISIAHKLQVQVVAQDVDSEEQMRFLKNAGCDLAQGEKLGSRLTPGELAELTGMLDR